MRKIISIINKEAYTLTELEFTKLTQLSLETLELHLAHIPLEWVNKNKENIEKNWKSLTTLTLPGVDESLRPVLSKLLPNTKITI